ncbi:MAG: cell wall-binding protein [Clostridium butyricum]|nr:cell wall-binding protein [Clostridium butyricum]
MQKNVKRIISATLAINAISAIIPASSSNLMITEVQAASEYGVSSLKLRKTSGSKTITLYEDSDYEDSVKFKKSRKKYYAKTDSSSVNIKVTEEDGYETKIFKTSSSSADAFNPEEKISIKSGTTTLYVRTYKDGEFNKDNVKENIINEYKLYVKKVSSEDEEDDDYDDIYLDDLTLTYKDDEIDFDFEEDKSTYDINVKNSITYVKVYAEPEDEEYSVRINGSKVDEDDDWEKKVNLEEGKNTIIVKIKYDGDERIYTLNITRKASSSSNNTDNSADSDESSNSNSNSSNINSNNSNTNNNNSNTNTNSNISGIIKANQWVVNNGKWQYNDASGNPIKNTWFYDRSYGQTYYLDANGNMVTGWLYKDNKWYYLNNSGAKQTGWQLVQGTWYYLDSAGVMKTGWLKDLDGRWYYLQANGAMAKNTTVDGYKLGSNGAWIR